MSGVPDSEQLTDFAQSMHKIWGTASAKETIQIRREEDKQAASNEWARKLSILIFWIVYIVAVKMEMGSIRGCSIYPTTR